MTDNDTIKYRFEALEAKMKLQETITSALAKAVMKLNDNVLDMKFVIGAALVNASADACNDPDCKIHKKTNDGQQTNSGANDDGNATGEQTEGQEV